MTGVLRRRGKDTERQRQKNATGRWSQGLERHGHRAEECRVLPAAARSKEGLFSRAFEGGMTPADLLISDFKPQDRERVHTFLLFYATGLREFARAPP